MPKDIPEFQSEIPSHLFTNCNRQDRWIMEQLSIQKQQNNWIIENYCLLAATVEEVEKRTHKMEGWKKNISMKWGLVVFIATIAFTAFVTAASKWLWSKLFP